MYINLQEWSIDIIICFVIFFYTKIVDYIF